MDLECAAGHFAVLAEAADHQIEGVDIENPLCAQLAQRLGVRRTVQRVHPRFFQRDRAGERFDLFTGLLVNFNIAEDRLWGEPERARFLEGVEQALTPGGQLCLLLNNHSHFTGLRGGDGSLQRRLQTYGVQIFPYPGLYHGPRLCLYRKPTP